MGEVLEEELLFKGWVYFGVYFEEGGLIVGVVPLQFVEKVPKFVSAKISVATFKIYNLKLVLLVV